MNSAITAGTKRKRAYDKPTLDDFYTILQKLSSISTPSTASSTNNKNNNNNSAIPTASSTLDTTATTAKITNHKNDTLNVPAFTKEAVMALRTAYFSYLQQVASSLVEHDKLSRNDDDLVVETACGLNGTTEFVEWTKQAKELLWMKQREQKDDDDDDTENPTGTANSKQPTAAAAASRFIHSKSRRKKKQQLVSAEMEAEQERLLQQAKDAMMKTRMKK